MKLKIEKEFRDKFTGQMYKVGEEVIFNDERAKELLSDDRNLVTKVKETPKETPKKSVKKSKK